jgi:hypothetical protein
LRGVAATGSREDGEEGAVGTESLMTAATRWDGGATVAAKPPRRPRGQPRARLPRPDPDLLLFRVSNVLISPPRSPSVSTAAHILSVILTFSTSLCQRRRKSPSSRTASRSARPPARTASGYGSFVTSHHYCPGFPHISLRCLLLSPN